MIQRRFLLLAGVAALASCARQNPAEARESAGGPNEARFANSPFRALSEADWRSRLSPEAFAVLRREGTERRYTSPLNEEHRRGVYVCAGCALPLFKSEWKFESGTGWPSFYDVIAENIGTKEDVLLFTPRTEYHCARCLGHQGHVFDDGPPPTRLRYCNNGVALDFLPA
jgi:peptide-methionine (R)-S-oxide reductase